MTEPLADPLWRNATDLCRDLQGHYRSDDPDGKCLRAYRGAKSKVERTGRSDAAKSKPWPWLQPQMPYPLPSAGRYMDCQWHPRMRSRSEVLAPVGVIQDLQDCRKQDDELARRLREAGAIFIGHSNMPEFGLGRIPFNQLYGHTYNPWDLSKTPGGSSGGAAVALAADMLPLADGSDLGGSLRNPASFCNVVGFRPSIGRMPFSRGFGWYGRMVTTGPMAKNVRDTILLFSVMAGPHAVIL